MQVGFATSLGLLERNNADVEKFMELLRESKLYAPTFDKKLPRMLDRDFTNPNFPTKVRRSLAHFRLLTRAVIMIACSLQRWTRAHPSLSPDIWPS